MPNPWGEFSNTILRFANGAIIDLRISLDEPARAILARFGIDGSFGIVTACNPDGVMQPSVVNRQRAAALEQELEERGIPWVPIDACSPDGSHCEASVILTRPRDEVIALARRYSQLAIFWFDGADAWIVPVLANHPPLRLPAQ